MSDTIEQDINQFWDIYEQQGIEGAVRYVETLTEGASEDDQLAFLKDNIPSLVAAAKERSVDMVKFLTELDEVEARNATGTSDDADVVSADSSDDDAQPEDETESAEAPASGGEADSGEEES